jgi:hypothetical protein
MGIVFDEVVGEVAPDSLSEGERPEEDTLTECPKLALARLRRDLRRLEKRQDRLWAD